MELENLRQNVIRRLQVLPDDSLKEVASELGVEVAAGKLGRKGIWLNTLVRHLTSEAIEDLEDEGLSTFLKLTDDLDKIETEVAEDEETKFSSFKFFL